MSFSCLCLFPPVSNKIIILLSSAKYIRSPDTNFNSKTPFFKILYCPYNPAFKCSIRTNTFAFTELSSSLNHSSKGTLPFLS